MKSNTNESIDRDLQIYIYNHFLGFPPWDGWAYNIYSVHASLEVLRFATLQLAAAESLLPTWWVPWIWQRRECDVEHTSTTEVWADPAIFLNLRTLIELYE
jgi:hypothetical protein